jgi:hypothetical protein
VNAGGQSATGIFCCLCEPFRGFCVNNWGIPDVRLNTFNPGPPRQISDAADLDGLPSTGEVVFMFWGISHPKREEAR